MTTLPIPTLKYRRVCRDNFKSNVFTQRHTPCCQSLPIENEAVAVSLMMSSNILASVPQISILPYECMYCTTCAHGMVHRLVHPSRIS